MKTTKLAFVFLLLASYAVPLLGQEYAFKVLVNKGKNEVKAGETWQGIKVGTSLKSTDELKVTENSYVGLVHKTGKPLEIKKAGRYKIADLSGQVGTGSSVLSKYTDFILSSNTTKSNTMAATGAVHRGTDFPLYIPQNPQQPLVFNNKIILSWEGGKTSGPYVVYFKSLFDDELAKIETSGNTLEIDLDANNFLNEDNIVVQVFSTSTPPKSSEKYNLKRLSKADKERVRNALSEISESLQEETALNKILLAGFYEKNNLLIDAATAHLEAIQLAPDVPAFQEGFNAFLLRNGLKPTSKK
jgi:hypothetical protein